MSGECDREGCPDCEFAAEQARRLNDAQADSLSRWAHQRSTGWGPKSDAEFLAWLAERLVNVYDESPNVDFFHRLRAIAAKCAGQPDLTPSEQEADRNARGGS